MKGHYLWLLYTCTVKTKVELCHTERAKMYRHWNGFKRWCPDRSRTRAFIHQEDAFYEYRNPIINLRRSDDRRRFIMRIPKSIRCRLSEWRPRIHSALHTLSLRKTKQNKNKANLRDLIAATGLVISNWIQIVDFSAGVTLKFDRWPPKTIGHFFYTTSSFVHHFKFIGELKPEFQSRNAQFGSKLAIFCLVWCWNLMDDLAKQ